MRKAVVLSLAVLAIAFLPVLATANAPIFIDVPGMITIGPNGSGDSVYVDAFGSTLDESVYDPDTADANLSWTFQEEAAAAGIITVNGQGPGVELRTDANSTFDIEDTSKASSGTVGIDPADYAGTNAAAPIAGAGTATKITVQCSDGTHQTEKEILIVSNTTAGNSNNGISAPVSGYSYQTGASYGTWADDNPAVLGNPAAMTFVASTTPPGLSITSTVGDNTPPTTFDVTAAYVAGKISPGYLGPNNLGAAAVDIQQGKMYRMRSTVTAAGVAAGDMHDNMKFRLRAGTLNTATFDIQSLYVNQGYRNLFASSRGKKTPWHTNAQHSATYDNIFVPPQEARFAGIGYGGTNGQERNYKMFFDVMDFDDYFYEGSLTFGLTEVEELDRPEVGSNGYLRAWGAGAAAFNEPAQPRPSGTLASAGALGWNYDAINYSEWSIAGVAARHEDLQPGSGITDNITTATYSGKNGGTELGIETAISGFNITSWEIGKPNGSAGAGTYPFNASSVIDYESELLPFSDYVYYRLTVTIQDNDGIPTNNPSLRLRLGNGFSTVGNHLVIANGGLTTAGPNLDPTVYEVWFRAPSNTLAEGAAEWAAGNNLEAIIEVLDDSNTTGDIYTISDVRIEAFPVNYFDN